jgi:hypothetical protein
MSTHFDARAARIVSAGPGIQLTAHAQARIRQRGFREEDLKILLACGSRSHDGALTLTQRDAAEAKNALRRRMAALDRLTGMTAIVDGNQVITVYRIAKSARLKRGRPEDVA